jgi:organic hydroperoxide reductase OsmC/OhrA
MSRMQPLPHRYRAHAHGGSAGSVTVGAAGLAPIETNAPPEFGGPEGAWSPETLLMAAIADCYILSFRAAARGAGLAWENLAVDVEAMLELVDGVARFTRVRISPQLGIPVATSETRALEVMHKAKRMCLVTNSLSAQTELATLVYSAESPAE